MYWLGALRGGPRTSTRGPQEINFTHRQLRPIINKRKMQLDSGLRTLLNLQEHTHVNVHWEDQPCAVTSLPSPLMFTEKSRWQPIFQRAYGTQEHNQPSGYPFLAKIKFASNSFLCLPLCHWGFSFLFSFFFPPPSPSHHRKLPPLCNIQCKTGILRNTFAHTHTPTRSEGDFYGDTESAAAVVLTMMNGEETG